MITFYLLIIAGLIKIVAAIIVQRINKKDPNFADKDNRKLIGLIKAVNYFAIALIILAVLLAIF